MKSYSFFSILVCCLFALLWVMGCEKSADQAVTFKGTLDEYIQYREVGSCDQCPDDDCCCGIELVVATPERIVRLCGTSDGAGSCSFSTPSPCSSISGGGQSKTLNVSDPKLLFCMVKGNSLAISNGHLSAPAILSITCQYGITNPQTWLDTIPASGTHFYLINNFCVVDECEP